MIIRGQSTDCADNNTSKRRAIWALSLANSARKQAGHRRGRVQPMAGEIGDVIGKYNSSIDISHKRVQW